MRLARKMLHAVVRRGKSRGAFRNALNIAGRLGTLPAPILVFKEVGIGSVALHPSCGFRRMNGLIQVLTIANI